VEENFQKKKKIGDFVFDFDQLDALVEKIMKQMAPELPRNLDKPVVFGFSMRLDSNGNPIIENFEAGEKNKPTAALPKALEPLVDVQGTEKTVLVTVELPGIEKKDLGLNVLDEHTLEIIVAGQNPFYKRIIIPDSIKNQKAKAEFKNGILEINLEKSAQKGKAVKIK